MTLNSTKKLKKSDLSITIVLLIGIIVLVNFFSSQLFIRWDLTENNVFSISNASKKTLRNLDDIVSVKAYFSENLPSHIYTIRQNVEDILDEYSKYSGGKFKVEYIDPSDDEELQMELYRIGIPQLTFDVLEKDKRQLVKGYLGISISYGGNTEAIPAIKQDTSDLEYQLTTAVKKVTSDEVAKIGWLSSNGALSLEENMKAVNDEIGGLYNIQNIDLSQEPPNIPPSIDTLVMVGPKEKFSEEAVGAVKEYLNQGKSLLVLNDGVEIGEGLTAAKNENDINLMLEDYGITINTDLVADVQSGMASFSQGFFSFRSNYAFWPMITNEGFNQESVAVKDLEEVVLPWASSIELDNAKLGEDKIKVLAKTTAKGWHVADNYNVMPNSANSPQGSQQEYNLAVLAQISEDTEEVRGGRIAVVGDSDFAADNFIGGNPDNLILFQNLVDILSLDDELIQVRSKVVSSRPIKELSDSQRAAIRYFNIFGMTVLVLAYGLGRYYMRRKSRFADDL